MDFILGGFRPSDLIVVGARPSSGKTDFALNVAWNAAIEGVGVAFFSTQTPAQRVVRRLMAAVSDVNSHRMGSGFLAEKDFPRLAKAAGRIHEAPLFLDDTLHLDLNSVIAKVRSSNDKKIALVIIDGFQQLNKREALKPHNISTGLKALAQELNLPVVVTTNISAKADRRQNKRPLLIDLENEPGLEQEADVILLLYRDELYSESAASNTGILEVNVAKNRNGPIGHVVASYRPEISRISDFVIEQQYEEEESSSDQ